MPTEEQIAAEAQPAVYLAALETDSIYFSWYWSESVPQTEGKETAQFATGVLPVEAVAKVRDILSSILEYRLVGGAIVLVSPFASGEAEQEFSKNLSELLVKKNVLQSLVTEIAQHYTNTGQRVRLSILPSSSIARLPWELLPVQVGTKKKRLIEIVDLCYELPLGIHVDRAPASQGQSSEASLWVIDPKNTGEGQVLESKHINQLTTKIQVASQADPAGLTRAVILGGVAQGGQRNPVSRRELAEALREHWPKCFVFIGHVISVDSGAGESPVPALMLSDPPETFGMTGLAGPGQNTRPLSALDLMAGLSRREDRLAKLRVNEQNFPKPKQQDQIIWPVAKGAQSTETGAALWPMPKRAVLVACASGEDHRTPEPFGLALALAHSGSEVIAATKWTLPTDKGLAQLRTSEQESSSIVQQEQAEDSVLAGAVLQLQGALTKEEGEVEAVQLVSEWQRGELKEWLESGKPQHSPIIWAAVSTFLAPRLQLEHNQSESM